MEIKFGKGFEQFDSPLQCTEALDYLNQTKTFCKESKPWYNVSGTPVESLWGSNDVNYNGDKYDFLGWGDDRSTPWGPLPFLILAVRSDLAKLIRGNPIAKKPLMGPDWKPAPGFERL